MTRFLKSTLGMKILVALTGLVLFGFLVGHVAGNLLVFVGKDMFNNYAKTLEANKEMIWGARAVLLGSVLLHIVLTILLIRRSSGARPVGYASKSSAKGSIGARLMMLTGPMIGAFIVFHILHFTTKTILPEQGKDLYENVKMSFSADHYWVPICYVIALLAMFSHLAHGIWSVFQTLGLNPPQYDCKIRKGAGLVALAIVFGFLSIPISFLLGILS